MRKYKWSLLFSGIMLVITFWCYGINIVERDTSELYFLIYSMTSGMKIRQILCVFFLILVGGWALYSINESFDTIYLALLSYPFGICIWIAISVVILLIGVPYTLPTMIIAIVITEMLLFFIRRGKKCFRYDREILIHALIILIGVVSIASSGLLFTFSSPDSHYFIEILGKSFVIKGKLLSDFKTYLFNTGVGVATLSSLTYMFGADTIYIVQQCLVINMFILFYYSLFLRVKTKYPVNKAQIISAICTILLYFLPQIQLLAGWIISNAYIMVYYFIIMLLFDKIKEKIEIPLDYKIILTIMFTCLVYMRTDAGITSCCIFMVVSVCRIKNKDILLCCIVPSILASVALYLKIYLLTIGNVDGMMLNKGTIGAIILLYFVLCVYYCLVRGKILLHMQKHFEILSLVTLLIFLVILLILNPQLGLESMRILLHNFTYLYHYLGGFWGNTLVFIVILWWLSYQINGGKMTLLEFSAILMVLVNINMVILRGSIIGVPIREGSGDSFNRAFISFLPLIVYAILERMLSSRKQINLVGDNYV